MNEFHSDSSDSVDRWCMWCVCSVWKWLDSCSGRHTTPLTTYCDIDIILKYINIILKYYFIHSFTIMWTEHDCSWQVQWSRLVVILSIMILGKGKMQWEICFLSLYSLYNMHVLSIWMGLNRKKICRICFMSLTFFNL